MRLRHSLLQRSAVWCNLEAACYETDYQNCRIILPWRSLCFREASKAFRESVHSRALTAKGDEGSLDKILGTMLGGEPFQFWNRGSLRNTVIIESQ
jgi:hypothetical protein